MRLTSVILAAGHGTRMKSMTERFGVPKHLLPLGNGETPVGRLARQLREKSDRIICLVQSGQESMFQERLPDVEILSSRSNGIPFIDSLKTLHKKANISGDMTLFTTGDLVFDDHVVESSIAEIKDPHNTYLFTQEGRHWYRIHIRFFCTPRQRIDTIMAHPPHSEKVRNLLFPLIRAYGYDLLRARIKRKNISLIANLNRPADLEHAQQKLTQK